MVANRQLKVKKSKALEKQLKAVIDQEKHPPTKGSKKKITAMISNSLLNEVAKFTKAKNITDSLTSALEDWVRTQRLNKLFDRIRKKPLEFAYSAEELRELNRKIT